MFCKFPFFIIIEKANVGLDPHGCLIEDPQIFIADPNPFIGDPPIFIGDPQILIGDP